MGEMRRKIGYVKKKRRGRGGWVILIFNFILPTIFFFGKSR